MPIVQLIQGISGLINGQEWPPVGGTIEVPDSVAADLLRLEQAVLVEDEPADEPAAVEVDDASGDE